MIRLVLLTIFLVGLQPGIESRPSVDTVKDKIIIDLVYDVKSVEWKNFVVNQLYPNYYEFKNYYSFRFYPLADGTVSGSDLCYIMSNDKHYETHIIEYMSCLTRDGKSRDECFEENTDNIEELARCTESINVSELLKSCRDVITGYNLYRFPAVILNKNFNQLTSDLAIRDLKSVLCKHMDHLDICITDDMRSFETKKLLLDIFFDGNSLEWKNFVQNQLYPVYSEFKDFIRLRFYPLAENREIMQEDLCYIMAGFRNNDMDLVNYLKCFYQPGVKTDKEMCFQNNQGDDRHLLSCTDTAYGLGLLDSAKQYLTIYNPDKLPTIVIDETFDAKLNTRILREFKIVLCEKSEYELPGCRIVNKIKSDDVRIEEELSNYLVMDIFYDSSKSEWIEFFDQQLYPMYEHFKDYVHFRFIPLGIDRTGVVPSKYFVNGLTVLSDELCYLMENKKDYESSVVRYLKCTNALNWARSRDECYDNYIGERGRLSRCAEKSYDRELVTKYREILSGYGLMRLPSFAFNRIFNQEVSDMVFKDLKLSMCERVPKVGVCGVDETREIESKTTTMDILFITTSLEWREFLQKQLYPYFNMFKDSVRFRFYPLREDYTISQEDMWYVTSFQKNDANVIKYLNCLYTTEYEDKDGCFAESLGDWNELSRCRDSIYGMELLEKNKKVVSMYNPTVFPTIIIDEKIDDTLSSRLVKDFKTVMCDRLNNEVMECGIVNNEKPENVKIVVKESPTVDESVGNTMEGIELQLVVNLPVRFDESVKEEQDTPSIEEFDESIPVVIEEQTFVEQPALIIESIEVLPIETHETMIVETPVATEEEIFNHYILVDIFFNGNSIEWKEFVQNQLLPLYDSFSEHVQFRFIPLDVITSTVPTTSILDNVIIEGLTVSGTDLCYLMENNKQYEGSIVEYLKCVYSIEGSRSKQECFDEFIGDEIELHDCTSHINSLQGSLSSSAKLYRDVFKTYKLNSVPSAIISHRLNPQVTRLTLSDLKSALCEQLPDMEICNRVQGRISLNGLVTLDIYFDTHSLEWNEFVQKQFYPAYNDFKDNLRIRLYPFGDDMKVSIEDISYMKGIGDTDAAMEYVKCVYRIDPKADRDLCFNKLQGDWEAFNKWKTSKKEIDKYSIIKVPKVLPKIVVNEQDDDILSARLLSNFRGVMCEKTNNELKGCSMTETVKPEIAVVVQPETTVLMDEIIEPDYLVIDIVYDVNSLEWREFLHKQLYPVYRYFKDYIRLRFIPLGMISETKEIIPTNNLISGLTIMTSDLSYLLYNEKRYESSVIEYLKCVYSTFKPRTKDECFIEYIGDSSELAKRKEKETTAELIKLYREIISGYKLTQLPSVILRKTFDQELSNRAVKDFEKVLCENIKNVDRCIEVNAKIVLDVYFDVKSKEWRDFLQNQLYSVFTEFKKDLRIRFYPINDNEKISKNDLCYMKGFMETDSIIKYMKCVFTIESTGDRDVCFNQNRGRWDEFVKCRISDLEEFSGIKYPKSFPTIIMNEDDTLSARLLKDFRSVLCEKSKLEGCPVIVVAPIIPETTPSTVITGENMLDYLVIDIVYDINSLEWKEFVQKQLYPIYAYYKNFIRFRFIPMTFVSSIAESYVYGLSITDLPYLMSNEKRYEGSVIEYLKCLYSIEKERTRDGCFTEFIGDATELSRRKDSVYITNMINEYREIITRYKLIKFPSIIFHNEFNQEVSDRAVKNLEVVLCGKMKIVARCSDIKTRIALETSEMTTLDLYFSSDSLEWREFLHNQLFTVYNDFKNDIRIRFYPMGHDKRILRDEMCYINESKDTDSMMKYIRCAYRMDFKFDRDTCFSENIGSWERLASCKTSLAELSTFTLPNVLPTIIINDKYDEILSVRLLKDLRGVLCEKSNYELEGCHKISIVKADELEFELPTLMNKEISFDLLTIDVIYDENSFEWKKFLQTQLYPLYGFIKNYVQFTFIPIEIMGKTVLDSDLSYLMYNEKRYEISVMEYLKCVYSMNRERTKDECYSENIGDIDQFYRHKDRVRDLDVSKLYNEIVSGYRLTTLPSIAFRHEFNQEISDLALKDFKSILCSKFKIMSLCGDTDNINTLRFGGSTSDLLTLDIFYDVDSLEWKEFVRTQLYSVYNELREFIRLRFYPTRKNLMLSKDDLCYITAGFKDYDVNVVEYLRCLYAIDRKPDRDQCFSETRGDWAELIRCRDTTYGSELVERHRKRMSSSGVTILPTITVDGIVDEEFSRRIFTNFKAVLCEKLNRDIHQCYSVDERRSDVQGDQKTKQYSTNNLIMDIYYDVDSLEWKEFVQKQLYPVYSTFMDYVHIRFVPLSKAVNPSEFTPLNYYVNGLTISGSDLCYLMNNEKRHESSVVEYMKCLYSIDGTRSKDECFDQFIGDRWELNNCLSTAFTSDSYRLNREILSGYSLLKLPSVIFNSNYNFQISEMSLVNLNSVLREKVKTVKIDSDVMEFNPKHLDSKRITLDIIFDLNSMDWKTFVETQLYPNYNHFKDYLRFRFYPIREDLSLSQDDMCYIMGGFRDQDSHLIDYLNCVYKVEGETDRDGCFSQSGGDWTGLAKCRESLSGLEFLELSKKVLESYNTRVLPAIVINNKIDEELNTRMLKNFRRVLCDRISYELPICYVTEDIQSKRLLTEENSSNYLNVEFVFDSENLGWRKYFITQLYPLYEQFKELVHFRFIPLGDFHQKTQHLPSNHVVTGLTVLSSDLCFIMNNEKRYEPSLFEYFKCIYSTDPLRSKQECFDEYIGDIHTLKQCTDTAYGSEQITTYRNILADCKLTKLPSIVFNKVYNENVSEAAFCNLRSVLCEKLNNFGLCSSTVF